MFGAVSVEGTAGAATLWKGRTDACKGGASKGIGSVLAQGLKAEAEWVTACCGTRTWHREDISA